MHTETFTESRRQPCSRHAAPGRLGSSVSLRLAYDVLDEPLSVARGAFVTAGPCWAGLLLPSHSTSEAQRPHWSEAAAHDANGTGPPGPCPAYHFRVTPAGTGRIHISACSGALALFSPCMFRSMVSAPRPLADRCPHATLKHRAAFASLFRQLASLSLSVPACDCNLKLHVPRYYYSMHWMIFWHYYYARGMPVVRRTLRPAGGCSWLASEESAEPPPVACARASIGPGAVRLGPDLRLDYTDSEPRRLPSQVPGEPATVSAAASSSLAVQVTSNGDGH